jgi:hypothetical protein
MIIVLTCLSWCGLLALFVGVRIKATKSRPDRGVHRRLNAGKDSAQAAGSSGTTLPIRF